MAIVLLGFLAAACPAPAPDEPVELETVDVAPPIDAELSTEGDLLAVERAARISGLIPDGLPADLPLFAPASVIDYSEPGAGRAWVELDAAPAPAAVKRWLGERLPAAGWTVSAIGGDRIQARKGDRRVDYLLTDLAPGTRIRLEYAPRR